VTPFHQPGTVRTNSSPFRASGTNSVLSVHCRHQAHQTDWRHALPTSPTLRKRMPRCRFARDCYCCVRGSRGRARLERKACGGDQSDSGSPFEWFFGSEGCRGLPGRRRSNGHARRASSSVGFGTSLTERIERGEPRTAWEACVRNAHKRIRDIFTARSAPLRARNPGRDSARVRVARDRRPRDDLHSDSDGRDSVKGRPDSRHRRRIVRNSARPIVSDHSRGKSRDIGFYFGSASARRRTSAPQALFLSAGKRRHVRGDRSFLA
jgi:hypothetical protein